MSIVVLYIFIKNYVTVHYYVICIQHVGRYIYSGELTYSGAYDMWFAFASDQAMATIDKIYISTNHGTIDCNFWKFEKIKFV